MRGFLGRLLPFRFGRGSRRVPTGWSIVSAVNDETGAAAVLRIRDSKPERDDVASLTAAIVIKWPYESDDPMPTPEVNERQLRFETAIDPLSEENANSELALVHTGMGVKEWTFYARDREVFMAELNGLLADHPPYPIEIELGDDPEWAIWADFRHSYEK